MSDESVLVICLRSAFEKSNPVGEDLIAVDSQLLSSAAAAIESLVAERDRLKEEVNRWMSLSGDICDLAIEDGYEVERLRKEIERLREALEPFAKAADQTPLMVVGGEDTRPRNPADDDRFEYWSGAITWGSLRRARAALRGDGEAK